MSKVVFALMFCPLRISLKHLRDFSFNSKISVCKIIEAKQFWDPNKKKWAKYGGNRAKESILGQQSL
jgi:hypothetical protein